MSVTVWIPTWNRAHLLPRAVASAAMQSPLEVIVIDDASDDDTPEVARRLVLEHPCVRYVRSETKAECWLKAVTAMFGEFRGEQIIGLGSDDALLDGIVQSVEANKHEAVVFHDYLVANTSHQVVGGVSMGYDREVHLDAAGARNRLFTHPYASETGIGSSLRRDCLLWLAENEWWRMGPYADAIGYSAVAALWGCAFVPGAGSIFVQDDKGYGETHREGVKRYQYHEACRQFLRDVGVPREVAASILTKRGIHP